MWIFYQRVVVDPLVNLPPALFDLPCVRIEWMYICCVSLLDMSLFL